MGKRGDDITDDDEAFPRDDCRYGSDHGRFLCGWPTQIGDLADWIDVVGAY